MLHDFGTKSVANGSAITPGVLSEMFEVAGSSPASITSLGSATDSLRSRKTSIASQSNNPDAPKREEVYV